MRDLLAPVDNAVRLKERLHCGNDRIKIAELKKERDETTSTSTATELSTLQRRIVT